MPKILLSDQIFKIPFNYPCYTQLNEDLNDRISTMANAVIQKNKSKKIVLLFGTGSSGMFFCAKMQSLIPNSHIVYVRKANEIKSKMLEFPSALDSLTKNATTSFNVVVDDLVCTGSTLYAISKTLEQEGILNIHMLCLATVSDSQKNDAQVLTQVQERIEYIIKKIDVEIKTVFFCRDWSD